MKRRDFLTQSTCAVTIASGSIPFLQADEKIASSMPDYRSTGVKLITNSTPAADGFRFPAEWDKHEYTLMVMPPPQNWKGYGIPLADVRSQWANVANSLSEFERVVLVVHPDERRHAKGILNKGIELIDIPVNDGWARDSGPMILEHRTIAPWVFCARYFPSTRFLELFPTFLAKGVEGFTA